MSYIIRELTHDDFEASMALASYAFRNEFNDEQREYQRHNFFGINNTRYGLFEGDQLCSQLMLYHFEFYLQGNVIKGSGVSFVSSWPEYRRKGYVAKLLDYTLRITKDKDEIISVLHPFSVPFYRKFGYELLSQRVKNSMPVNQIKRTDIKGQIVRESNYARLQPMYDKYSSTFNGMIARGSYHWENAVPRRKKGSIIIYKNESNEDRGYMIYHIAPQSQQMNILEFVALDKEASQALWSFVGQHDSMLESVEWYTPISDKQFSEQHELRVLRQIEQYGMARVVNVKAFINQFSFLPSFSDEQTQFYLHIEDNQADWNNGIFSLVINPNGQASLTEINILDKIATKPMIKMNINTLSGLAIGYYSGDHLLWNERIVGDEETIRAFINRIPQRETQLIDFF